MVGLLVLRWPFRDAASFGAEPGRGWGPAPPIMGEVFPVWEVNREILPSTAERRLRSLN
jgi:hypothetical protein